MAWHIVRSFESVGESGIVLGDQALEKIFQVAPCGGIGIFHQHQAAAGVLAVDIDETAVDPAGGDNSTDIACYLVVPFAASGDSQLFAEHAHADNADLYSEAVWLPAIMRCSTPSATGVRLR